MSDLKYRSTEQLQKDRSYWAGRENAAHEKRKAIERELDKRLTKAPEVSLKRPVNPFAPKS